MTLSYLVYPHKEREQQQQWELCVFPPGCRNERLDSHEKQKHDEGADQVGVEHFIPHLGELDRPKEIKVNIMCSVIVSYFLPVPASTPAYLVLYVCVFEHQGQRSDVLPVHPIAASDLDGVFDAFVNLLGGGMPYVGHRAVRKRGQDLLGKEYGGFRSIRWERVNL